MRNRLYGGVRGRKMKVGGNYFIFLLLDYMIVACITLLLPHSRLRIQRLAAGGSCSLYP
jgi:hypothetical protein